MPNPSELQREDDGLSSAERYAAEYRRVTTARYDEKGPIKSGVTFERERQPGEYECRSPMTYGSIIGQDVEGLLAEAAMLRDRIKELELELERVREREMLSDRIEMNRRDEERRRKDICQHCGYPTHPLNYHERGDCIPRHSE